MNPNTRLLAALLVLVALLAAAAGFFRAADSSRLPDGAPATPAAPVAAGEAKPDSAEAVFLANAGFLLRAPGYDAVLIDAAVSQPYAGYGALSPLQLKELLASDSVRGAVGLVLATHPHGDHFQPGPASSILAAHPDALLLSSPQVIEQVVPQGTLNVRSIWPADGATHVAAHRGARVELFRLRHAGQRNRDVQNLGHLIELAGTVFFHPGDAETNPDEFARYGLEGRHIDVALIPFWYLDSESGRRIVYELIRPKRVIAMHIPPEERENVRRRFAINFPEVAIP